MSSDFHSLLSVFHDALGGSSSATSKSAPAVSLSTTVESGGAVFGNDYLVVEVDPESTIDPSYSASRLTERIERLLRVRGIRNITTNNASSSCSGYTTTNNRTAAHIAICATIVDTFPHEKLWRKWMDETGGEVSIPATTNKQHEGNIAAAAAAAATGNTVITASAEMYIHAKFPEHIQSNSWLQSKTIPISHKPNWNDVRIVRALLSLIQTALRSNEHTTHLLFCTESCIPIATLKESVRSVLLDEICPWVVGDEEGTTTLTNQPKKEDIRRQSKIDWDRSYVDYYNRDSPQCTRFDEHNCWEVLRDCMPLEIVHKALPGWCLLSRKHAQAILDTPAQLLGGMNLWPAFDRVWAPEEVFIPTALALTGNLDGVIRRALTHSKWDTKAKDHKDRAHPLSYDGNFDDELVSRARAEGCLFLRKMKRSLDISVWERIVIQRKRGRDSVIAGDKTTQEMERSSRDVETSYSSRMIHDHQRRIHDSSGRDRRKRDWDNDSNIDHRRKRRHW